MASWHRCHDTPGCQTPVDLANVVWLEWCRQVVYLLHKGGAVYGDMVRVVAGFCAETGYVAPMDLSKIGRL